MCSSSFIIRIANDDDDCGGVKKEMVGYATWKTVPSKGLGFMYPFMHNQCRCNALPNYLSRSDTPSPLSPFGLLIIG
jgi:hypothetical protein